MNSLAEQNAVLDQPTHSIGGRRCHVKVPLPKNEDKRETRAPENVRLFVGRMNDKIGVKRLREFFNAEARKIDPMAAVTDTFIPQPFRGFGFINLSSLLVAKELLKKDTFVIDDTTVSLSIAAPKQQQQPQYSPYDLPPSSNRYDRGYERQNGGYYGQPYEPNPDSWESNYRFQSNGRHFTEDYEEGSHQAPYPGSSTISTGLETLDLGPRHMRQSDMMNEALKAFWSAASRSNPPHPPSHQDQHGRPARRGHPPATSPAPRWR